MTKAEVESLFPPYPLADYQHHRAEIDEAIKRTLSGGRYILGGEVASFEREFAAFTQCAHAIGVASGTDAIELILRAMDIGPGSLVALPSHTATASASAVRRAGAEPAFVDVEADTFTLCPRSLFELLNSAEGASVKAVLAVHLYGHPCDMNALREITELRGIRLIEDAAQAHGATHHGIPAGSLGDAAAFSFYPTKNLGAIGDGGAITTNDHALAEKLRQLREYGWKDRYVSAIDGVNSRLDEMQAAILRVKLATLPERMKRRRRLAAAYARSFEGIERVILPRCRAQITHGCHLYVVKSRDRDALLQHLAATGVPAAIHYPAAVHQQPAFSGAPASPGGLLVTEALMPEILTLPLHPYLTEDAVEHVAKSVGEFNSVHR